MTVLLKRKINGSAYLVNSGQGTSSRSALPTPAVPPALSDLAWSQPTAIHPSQSAGFFAWVNPVGGIGPFVYSIADNLGSKYDIDPITGAIKCIYNPVGTTADTLTITCVDGRNASVSRAFRVSKADGSSPVFFLGQPNNNQTNCSLNWFQNGPMWWIDVVGGDHSWDRDSVVLNVHGTNTVSPDWVENYAWIRGNGRVPAAGSYPLTMTATSASGQTVTAYQTLVIAPYQNPNYIEFVQSVVLSTATPVGTVIGKLCATTPNNTPAWSFSDPTGALFVNSATGAVSVLSSPATVGSLTLIATVTDQLATFTQAVPIAVVQGYVLPSTNMTMTVATNLTNYQYLADQTMRPVGHPIVTGIPGTITWMLQQARFCKALTDPSFQYYDNSARGAPLYRIDPATGATWAQGQISATTGEPLTIIATDGIHTCSQTYSVPVAAVVGPVIHIGRGMGDATTRARAAAAANIPAGTAGYEHLFNFRQLVSGDASLDLGANAGATFYVHYDSDTNYYANDFMTVTNSPGFYEGRGLNGPFKLIGVPDPITGRPPRLGGIEGSSNGGGDGKACLNLNDGDITIDGFEISFVFDPNAAFAGDDICQYWQSGVRQNGAKSGDVVINNCYIHDCQTNIDTGYSDGGLTITNTMLANGGGAIISGGNSHNAYIGLNCRLTVNNVLSYNAICGHDFKTRASIATITNSRFFDGTRGSASCQLDMPDGGNYTVSGCTFWKGAMPQNPFSVQYAAEVNDPQGIWIKYQDSGNNTLTLTGCNFIETSPSQLALGAICHFGLKSPNTGQYSSVSASNSKFYGYTTANATIAAPNLVPAGDTHDFSVILSNSTYSAPIPLLDFTPPTTYKGWARPGWFNVFADTENPRRFPNVGGVQIDPGVDQIRIPAGAAVGTVVFNPTPYGVRNYQCSPNPQPDPNINPFTAGTTWSKGQTLILYTGQSFGLAQDAYSIDAHSGQVTVAQVNSTPGYDCFEIRATAPSGKIAEFIFPIVRT